MKLAYADPPYPGRANLYPENTEVDHAALIEQLCEYDGWALSTDEVHLAYVLSLCPPKTRVLAWCRKNNPPVNPRPIAAWEPVLLRPARQPEAVFSYFVSVANAGWAGRGGLIGQKPQAFCEWVIRCLGAERGDTIDDLYPGTGIMRETWDAFFAQERIRLDAADRPTGVAWINQVKRHNTPLDGIDPGPRQPEKSYERKTAR